MSGLQACQEPVWEERMEQRCTPLCCTSNMRNRANQKRQHGNAVVEFALAWSLLSGIFLGVYQYGYAFYQYNALMTQVGVGVGAGLADDVRPEQYRRVHNT